MTSSKNAYLPYRDPETLKSFLKIIDEFSYDHSERLGDAFEYLLSVLGLQGDAGQFRTPRHIIDFMVEVLAPKKGEVILDPACGTAGFLISAYKHILRTNSIYMDGQDSQDKSKSCTSCPSMLSSLTPDEKGQLAKNFKGYDISPDMVRLSLVNLYLHGFTDPHVYEYDTLTSEERWNEFADVILANPPFMSPKGGIKPHKRFSIQAKRSEVLFVDYMAEHLTPTGRAGIIVPEGIIFQSQSAYTALRKMLVENSLVAVISLPAGVFQPYSGVKTSILILDKSLAKQANNIAFFKVENDGFGLGAQRRAIEKNDLPDVLAGIKEFLNMDRQDEQDKNKTSCLSCSSMLNALVERGLALVVPKEKIAANGDYNLSGERYREGVASTTTHKLVAVSRFMREGVKTIDPRNSPDELFELWSIPAFDASRPELLRGSEIGSQKKAVFPGDVLLSRIIPHIRRGWVVEANQDGRRQIASTEWIVFASDKVLPKYLRQLLVSDRFHASFMQTITGVGGSLSRANPGAVGEIQIPLPPLEMQKEIVAEIEGYQKVINGARAVLDHYRPHIPIHPDWPETTIGECCEVKGGKRLPMGEQFSNERTSHAYIRVTDLRDQSVELGNLKYIPEAIHKEIARYTISSADVYISIAGTIGLMGTIPAELDGANLTENAAKLLFDASRIDKRFLSIVGNGEPVQSQIRSLTHAVGVPKLALERIKMLRIPLPPLATQQQIVAEIEAEQALVAANRELITRFEQKIKATLARVWGEEIINMDKQDAQD